MALHFGLTLEGWVQLTRQFVSFEELHQGKRIEGGLEEGAWLEDELEEGEGPSHSGYIFQGQHIIILGN